MTILLAKLNFNFIPQKANTNFKNIFVWQPVQGSLKMFDDKFPVDIKSSETLTTSKKLSEIKLNLVRINIS